MATDYSLLCPVSLFHRSYPEFASSSPTRRPKDRWETRISERSSDMNSSLLFLVCHPFFLFSSVVFFFSSKILFLLSLSLLVFLTVHFFPFRSFPLPFLSFLLSRLVLIVFLSFSSPVVFSSLFSVPLCPSLSVLLFPPFRPLHNIYVADTFVHSD